MTPVYISVIQTIAFDKFKILINPRLIAFNVIIIIVASAVLSFYLNFQSFTIPLPSSCY
jgi:ABC-type transporter Mla maintaining outer membrane lipid asymmetry permease subunit MlaE